MKKGHITIPIKWEEVTVENGDNYISALMDHPLFTELVVNVNAKSEKEIGDEMIKRINNTVSLYANEASRLRKRAFWDSNYMKRNNSLKHFWFLIFGIMLVFNYFKTKPMPFNKGVVHRKIPLTNWYFHFKNLWRVG